MHQQQYGSTLQLRKNSRRGTTTIVLIALFLASVYISVSNIRLTVPASPDTFGGFSTPLDDIKTDDEKRDFVSFQQATATVAVNKRKGDTTREIDTSENLPTSDSNATRYDTVSHLPPLLSVIPNDNNTVISLISMGRSVDTFLVERCIRSIRVRGLFNGIIMVFTDSVGYKRFQETIPLWDNRTMIIQGRDEDMNPRTVNGNHTEPQLIKYKQNTMVFKRFKTHHSKYIAGHPTLSDSIRFVLYLDVDNIIGSRLDIFFEDYARMVTHAYFHRNFTSTAKDGVDKLAIESQTSNYGDFGFMSTFRDRHKKSQMHTGIIMYDLAFEKKCVNGWRDQMDTFQHSSDQTMLLRVLNDYARYRCTVFDFPPTFMTFANKAIMKDSMEERQGRRPKRKKPLQFPIFIHVTQFRVNKLNNATIHNEFVRHLLKLKPNETMTDTIGWEDVVTPSANRNSNMSKFRPPIHAS